MTHGVYLGTQPPIVWLGLAAAFSGIVLLSLVAFLALNPCTVFGYDLRVRDVAYTCRVVTITTVHRGTVVHARVKSLSPAAS